MLFFMKNLLTSQWTKIIYANYIIPTEIVEKRLPAHVKLDHLNGNCFLSLVGFRFGNVKLANVQLPTLADFEQVDLRVHVKRFDGTKWRKGSFVIARILDNAALKILAKILINANSRTATTRSEVNETASSLEVRYIWKYKDNDHQLTVKTENLPSPYQPDSETAFFVDRPYEYSAVSEKETKEVEFSHRHWHTYKVLEYGVKVDFAMEFGAAFSILSAATPYSVILAEGSTVEIRDNNSITS